MVRNVGTAAYLSNFLFLLHYFGLREVLCNTGETAHTCNFIYVFAIIFR